jgi:hypothetical protein
MTSTASSRQAMLASDEMISLANLTAIFPVARFTSELKNTLKLRIIPPAILQQYDQYFLVVMNALPEAHRINLSAPLDPSCLFPALSLQIARFHLDRHNLSSVSPLPERVQAIERCVQVAKDTVQYIYRMTQASQWQRGIIASANSILCTHLWRCTLVLCFRGKFREALECLGVSAVIGSVRRVNVSCGRNLSFFLDRLGDRIKAGRSLPQHLEQDEEMLAYLAGDLQGSVEASWIWNGDEAGISRTALTPSHPGSSDINPGMESAHHSRPSGLLTDSEVRDWPGWERLQQTMAEFLERSTEQVQPLQHHRSHPPPPIQAQIAPYYSNGLPPPPNPQSAGQSHDPIPRPATASSQFDAQPYSAAPSSGGSSRISIDKLI